MLSFLVLFTRFFRDQKPFHHFESFHHLWVKSTPNRETALEGLYATKLVNFDIMFRTLHLVHFVRHATYRRRVEAQKA